jgi:hypothetical protein
MGAIFAGHFEEGERLAQEALAIGQRLRGQDALGVFGVQMFTLRREQGRLQEVAAAVRHFVRMSPEPSRWRPGLALIYSELGYKNEARAEFEVTAAYDLADIPRDGMWVTCMMYLAEVCAFLGDACRAALLYQALLPYAGRNKVALLEGSPAEPGLFTIRLKFPDGYRIALHWHPACGAHHRDSGDVPLRHGGDVRPSENESLPRWLLCLHIAEHASLCLGRG